MQTLQERTRQATPVLITVNNDQFELNEALRRSFAASEEQFLNQCIDELLIRQYAAQNNISNSIEELQVAANERRYQNGLESVEKFQQWLKNNHQTFLSLQNDIDYQLLRNKVRSSISNREIEAYFAEHQLEFDRADLYSIRVSNQEKAEELYAKITEDGENFHLLAMEHSLDKESKPKGGYIGRVSRDELSAEIEAAVFNAQPEQVIGPVETEKGYNLFKVSAVYPADLAEEKDNIQFLLFEQLLTRLRAEAKINFPIFEKE